MAVNKDLLVSGETLSGQLIICLELGSILEALCLEGDKNRNAVAQGGRSSLIAHVVRTRGSLGMWTGDPSGRGSSKVAGFILITHLLLGGGPSISGVGNLWHECQHWHRGG